MFSPTEFFLVFILLVMSLGIVMGFMYAVKELRLIHGLLNSRMDAQIAQLRELINVQTGRAERAEEQHGRSQERH